MDLISKKVSGIRYRTGELIKAKYQMKIFFYFLFFFNLISFIYAEAQDCTCKALLPIQFQPRGPEKNIIKDSAFNKVNRVLSINDIYNWQKKYEKLTGTISWNPGNRNSKRRPGTPEDSLYIIKGYMWFVHQIGFDCDYHIEIGTKDSSATRIIVEVPYTNLSVQNKIKAHLDRLDLPILGCTEKNPLKAHFSKGIPVLIIGYGFYDSFHKVNKNHGDQHTKKYLWEIHPVTEINFLNEE